jgi:transcriptional regulator with XRE-family HTH domain
MHARLRAARIALKLSQTELAKLGNISRVSQSLYETGERSPDARYLQAVADHGIDVGWVLTGEITRGLEEFRGMAVRAFVALDELERRADYQLPPVKARVEEFATQLDLVFRASPADAVMSMKRKRVSK